MLQRLIFLGVLMIAPLSANASVVFSEIAWMGTDESADNEWIELFNHDFNMAGPGQNVDGWTLTDGGDINIALSGTIGPMTIVVLERTDDNSVPGVAAFATYTGSLANTGETLTLKDSSGNTVAEVVGGTDWANIGGVNEIPKKTPQQGQAGWVVGTPTPGAENIAHDELPEEEDDTATTTNTNRNSGGGSSSRSKVRSEESLSVENDLKLSISAPKVAYVNQAIQFEADSSGLGKTLLNSLVYSWNFGDTYTGGGKKHTHSYEYPGEYVVVASAAYASHHEIARHEIQVLPVALTLSRTPKGDILIKNESKNEMDLGGFTLGMLTFPDMTILKASGSLTLPTGRVGGPIVLYDKERVLVASLMPAPAPLPSRPFPVLATPRPAPAVLGEVSEAQADAEIEYALLPGTEPAEENVIQIGQADEKTSEGNVFSRFFKKLAGLLAL